MSVWQQAVISGISLGSFYVLLAMGFSLIFGVTHAFNLAHGELILLSGYLAYALWKFLAVPFYWTLPLCMLLLPTAALGLQWLLRRLPQPFEMNSLVVTFGLAIILQNLFLAFFSADFRLIMLEQSIILDLPGWSVLITANQVLLFFCSLGAVAVIHLFLHRTFLGKALRATIQDREGAALAGIRVGQMQVIAFAVGGGLIGLAGPLFATNMYLYPAGGMEATLIAIIITIAAGVGRTRSLLLSGWLLGLAESLATLLAGASWREMISAAVLILILLLRPQGLFAKKTAS
ncbi:branched-chain amino acid ABC transporter permease [Desulfobacca acetoxidans]|uniref:ABC-type transporter, integral membrane subunit n=1 Tax=Desulfobacca acetoxidans (strain ATCC 700848 / DSM 11109 / ASRB2) TaxID=880072 RepID=F2NGX5_DESAR|nr:branched-chain amino acid ABC transporter permease [Desulfobacca acetoxidans]AEB08746.1 ABC-type transporter, integral membrane subunit [Desulfobacca acetoxidans DSM 11109]